MLLARRLFRFAFRATLVMALLGWLAIGWVGSERLVSPPRRDLQPYHRAILDDPAAHGLRVTSFRARDGTPCLWVLPEPGARPARKSRQLRAALEASGNPLPPWGELRGTVVLLHGHRGRKEDHLPICERLCAAGFRCLLPDLPGHGDHPHGAASFGHREVAWLEDLHQRASENLGAPDQPAFLFGVSQGGAIALQAAARDPERWRGVVSIAAFAELESTMQRAAERLPPALQPLRGACVSAVHCGAWLRSGMWPPAVRPIDHAASLRQPVMIVHGADDALVPLADARELHRRTPSPRKRLWIVPDAGHGRVLAAAADRTYPEICRFLLDALESSPRAN